MSLFLVLVFVKEVVAAIFAVTLFRFRDKMVDNLDDGMGNGNGLPFGPFASSDAVKLSSEICIFGAGSRPSHFNECRDEPSLAPASFPAMPLAPLSLLLGQRQAQEAR